MQVIPVLDLMNGVVVRGVAGERDSYRPVKSCLVDSSDALDIADAIRSEFGFDRFYVADLDSIVHEKPNLETIRQLIGHGFRLVLDCGVKDVSDLKPLSNLALEGVVVALESMATMSVLQQAIQQLGSDNVVFSLDLKNAKPLTASSDLASLTPMQLAEQAVESGVRRMIVLDLAAVGVGEGTPTLDLCRSLRERFPSLQIVTGGGVSSVVHLLKASEAGVDGLLLASVLHDGRIRTRDLQSS